MNDLKPALFGAIALLVVLVQIAIVAEFKNYQSKVLYNKSKSLVRSIVQTNSNLAKECEKLTLRAITLNPIDGYANFQHGLSLYLLKNYPEAETFFVKSEKLLPHIYNAVRMIAYVKYYQDDFEGSARLFTDYLDMNPTPNVTPELVYRMTASALMQVTDLGTASHILNRATQFSLDKADLLHMRLTVAIMMNQPATSRYYYKAFRNFGPTFRLKPYELIRSVNLTNKIQPTINFLQSLHAENPDDVNIAISLAVALNQVKQSREAISLLEKELALHPNAPNLPLILGDILYADKQYDRAFLYYDKHLSLDPKSESKDDIMQKKSATQR